MRINDAEIVPSVRISFCVRPTPHPDPLARWLSLSINGSFSRSPVLPGSGVPPVRPLGP